MKNLRLAGILVFALIACSKSSGTQPTPTQTLTPHQTVLSTQPTPLSQQTFPVRPGSWVPTGIQLKLGDTFSVKATGELNWPGQNWKFGPNGYQIPGNVQGYVACIRVGSGGPIEIGSQGASLTALQEGELELSIPRCTHCVTANGSEVTAFGSNDTTIQGQLTFTVTGAKATASHVFLEPPPAEARGMRALDDRIFTEKAVEKNYFIIVRDSNPDAVQWIGRQEGNIVYKAKPEKLKAKTLKIGDYKGLAAADPTDDRLIALLAAKDPAMDAGELKKNPAELQRRYDSFKKDLAKDGFLVEGPDKAYLVYQIQGDLKAYFHGDYDLHGIYDLHGKLVNSLVVRGELNDEFGLELILHGAHDEWADRNKPIAGPNRGPQPPATVYLPDGTKQWLLTIPDMKQFYLEHKLDWATAYPDI